MATAIIRPLHPLDGTDLDEATGTTDRPSEKPKAFLLLLIVAAALAIRLIVVACIFRDFSNPEGHYERFGNEVGWIARSIALHQGFSSPFYPTTGPTALLPPLYPYLLALIFKVFGVYSTSAALATLSLNSLFSALTCIPIYLAARISIGARAALFAGWAWAIYPFAIYFSAGRVWEFSLTSLLLTTCFWLGLTMHRDRRPWHWLAYGVLFGLCGLSNPAVFSLFPVILLLPLWRLYRATSRTGMGGLLRSGAMAGLGIVMVLTPWTIRNYRVMHVLCPVRDCFWYEFWSANNGDGSNPTLAWTHPASNPAEMQLYQSLGEVAYVAQKRPLVFQFITHQPGFFAKLTLRRIVYYWTGFWSLDPAFVQQEPTQMPNVFFCSSLTLLMIFGGLNWGRRDPSAALAYLLSIAIFPITYYISHPLMDYRQPIEPEIVILVVMGLREVKARVAARLAASSSMDGGLAAEMGTGMGHSYGSPSAGYVERVDGSAGEPSATAG